MLPRTREGGEKQHMPGQRGEARVGGRMTISPRWSPNSPHEAGELSSAEVVATGRSSCGGRREDPQRESLRMLADLGDNGNPLGHRSFHLCHGAMGPNNLIKLAHLQYSAI